MIHPLDIAIFIAYMISMLAIGFAFMRKNTGSEHYFVGGRQMGSVHIGLSVVATDVGGGFSIGLGGLGFAMGISGSWMLFTGLLGAWLSAVFLIPKLKRNPAFSTAYTFPDFLEFHFGKGAALVAGLISGIGYLGFTASQILAGAKLASGTFPSIDMHHALIVMGVIAVVYTAMGGLKAVIYTDTVQWIVLMAGLGFIALPIGFMSVGGWAGITETLDPTMLSFGNLTIVQALNWAIAIVPIWFVGMTLYQRIYACKDERTAKRAWLIAGLFEWPTMAFLGVALGVLARVAAEQGMFGVAAYSIESETGVPMLLRTILPIGLMGLVMSAYFSAILSTADSCLMACSGNFVSDIATRYSKLRKDAPLFLRISQLSTLLFGGVAILLAATMTNVLDMMLYSYGFMVSGLFVPVLGALFGRRKSPGAAIAAMISGGTVTVLLELSNAPLWSGLDANLFGILTSAIFYLVLNRGRWIKRGLPRRS